MSSTPSQPATGREDEAAVVLIDEFVGALPRGYVVGGRTPAGARRQGIDLERVISVDNAALRIQPLLHPGWGRAGLSYGPFDRRSGRSVAVFMLNGHNTAQSEKLDESLRHRIGRWLRGAETAGRWRRLLEWLRSRRKGRTLRQMRWWRRICTGGVAVPRVDENLALGWFTDDVPADPLRDGHALVMHATGADNGELWAHVQEGMLPVVRGVQNLQVYYVVVLRDRGAAYYAASVAGANGLGRYPALRPLAIDAFGEAPALHAGLFQSTLGQIGFRVDSRVYGIRVADIPHWAAWYGTAHAADPLQERGALDGAAAEVGGVWQAASGQGGPSAAGVGDADDDGRAWLRPDAASGLVHVVIEVDARVTGVAGLVWRIADRDHWWMVRVDAAGSELRLCQVGQTSTVARSTDHRLAPGRSQSLQIVDDGRRFGIHLDGALLFGKRFDDARLADATGVGVTLPKGDSGVRLRRFEAHPRDCPLPQVLDMGAPWWRVGQRVVATEDFDGPPRELEGKPTTTGAKVWRRLIGEGHIDVTGRNHATVRASVSTPCPGRLAYAIDWDHADFADLEVEITPPGTGRGQGERGRTGFILWQDPDNYVALNIWCLDTYPGASTSTFFRIDGYEDLYDAVWSNVGDKVRWGHPFRLRIAFDGMRYMVFVDDEPVLYRALTDVYPDARRLRIGRVGLLSNWEWGTDSGSEFRRFRARV